VNLFVGEGSRPEFLKLNPARPEAPKRIAQLRAALGGN
jgi:hypothetical protein